MANLKYIGKNILNHDLILKKGNVSGSASSTGSFGNLNISSDASITGDMVVGGKLTAEEFHTEITSASIIFASGSTIFGDTSDDTHQFTGSLKVTETGSFGNVIASGDLDLGNFSDASTNLRIRTGGGGSGTGRINFRTSTDNYGFSIVNEEAGSSDRGLRFKRHENDATGVDVLKLRRDNGTIEFPIANQIISGSATSTGSFGRLETAGAISIGTEATTHAMYGELNLHGGSNNTFVVNALYSDGSKNADFTFRNPVTGANGGALGIRGYYLGANSKILSLGANTGAEYWSFTSTKLIGSAASTGSFGAIRSAGLPLHVGSGNVGIGLTNPEDYWYSPLVTYQASSNYLTIATNTNGISSILMSDGTTGAQAYAAQLEYQHATDEWRFHGGGSRFMTVINSNVGIGDTNPSEKLSVTGNIKASANITGSNLLVTSTGSIGRIEATKGDFLKGLTIEPDANAHFIRATPASNGYSVLRWNADNGDSLWNFGLASGNNIYYYSYGSSTVPLELHRDTGRVGIGLAFGADPVSMLQVGGGITANGNISGSLTSTGSFGRVKADSGSFDSVNTSGLITSTGGVRVTGTSKFTAHRSVGQYIEMYPDGNGSNYLQAQGNIRFAPNLGTKMILHANGRLGINTTTDAGYQIDVNGTGRFSDTLEATHFSGSQFTGIFNGALSSSAQIASNISGAFAVASASFAADILSNSSSFAARDTLSEATSSKILNGELEFTNITGSGHISMSLSSTGSFGRVSATTIGGHSPLVIDGETTFINSITSSAHVSSSMTSTASFGRVNVVALGGHQALTVDPITTFTNVITASSQVQFDGKIFIETGSIEGDLHVRTNENLMRIGKSTSGVIVSGSGAISRFATGSDGSIIDLGFTITDEDGNVVLAGDGDGIHVDSNNYWYNNKYYKVGDGSRNFLQYDPQDGMRYKGELVANTGSFAGEMFINSPTGSMFIGKFTGGIESSGSGNISRFATGSDGSIIDLGFTTTNEEGETVFLSTGDGIFRDSKNYWYTTGHFKIGDGQKQIEWNTTDLNVSASTVDVTTLKASDVNFSNLPTSDPLVTGSLWVSGSSASGSYKSGFVMISGIHG